MLRVLMYLGFLLSSNLLLANSVLQFNSNSLTSCGDMHEAKLIGKEMNELLHQEFCDDTVNPKKFASISQKVVQKIMTESFLEVTPPPNWQQLTDEIIKNCLENKDLCKKETRKEFETCVTLRMPLILLQFGPWFAENCSQLHKSLIEKWPNKKNTLKKIIDDNK